MPCFFVANHCFSAVDSVGGKRVLRAVVTAREDPGLVLSAVAMAIVVVVVVVVSEFVSLLAFTVTRLETGSASIDGAVVYFAAPSLSWLRVP